MLQKSKFFLFIGILTLLLAACGTSNKQESVKEPVDNSEQTNDQTDPQNEETTNNEQDAIKTRTAEQAIEYSLNGETKNESAQLVKSDNQNFSLYILPNFELTAEEPYKDLLFLSEDDSNSMRIEILPADTDRDSLKANTLLQLQVVNETVQTLDPPNDAFLQNATIMEASNNNGEVVTAYLIDQKKSIIKLTLFTKDQPDYRDAFIQMAKTMIIEE